MSSDVITLKLTERKEFGNKVKALRRTGMVPANIYEKGKESQAVSAIFNEITKVYHSAGKHSPVELTIDGKKRLAMIKDVDVDPVKNTVRHINFHAVNRNDSVEAEVPVRIEGEIPAVRSGYMVLHTLDTVDIEAKPADLPEELLADGTKLVEIGDKLSVADIKVPNGVTMNSDPNTTIAVVEEPKDQIAAAAAESDQDVDASDVPSEQGGDSESETEESGEEE